MKRLTRQIKKAHSHMKEHHKNYMILGFGIYSITKMLLLIVPFLIGFYIGMCNPDVNAKTWESNDNWIEKVGFWDQLTLPNDMVIIDALYGTFKVDHKTAYTLPWKDSYDGQCLAEKGMQVKYLSPGTNVIPENLNNNTIYVLEDGDYIIGYINGIQMNTCSAIIGKGDVFIYSTKQIKEAGMINNSKGLQYTILDNIKINGKFNSGKAVDHEINTYGIHMAGGELSTNTTLNRIQGYYNGDAVYFSKFKNASVFNSQFFNNTNGINIEQGEKFNIYNTKLFNNSSVGFSNIGGLYMSVNNSQIYNNSKFGGLIEKIKLPTVIADTYIYNNGEGLYISAAVMNILDSKVYNNKGGLIFNESKDNKYYGELQIFDNDVDFNGTNGYDGVFNGGLSKDEVVSHVTVEDGYINKFGCMSCARYSNPLSSDSAFMMDTFKIKNCEIKQKIEREDSKTVSYLYGSRIEKQKLGYIVVGLYIEDAITDFDSKEFIAQDDSLGEYTGDLACNFKDCDFDGKVLIHGDSILAYLSGGVDFGSSCVSEIRTCDDGLLDGTYEYPTCTVADPEDCDFSGTIVPHLAGIEAYFSTGVEYGSSCMSEIRVCYDGDLNGSAPYQICEIGDPDDCTFSGQTILHGSGIELYFSTGVEYGSSCIAETRVCNDGILNGSATYNGCEAALPANCYLNGTLILNGGNITVYEDSNVACGHTCQSESRTCDNGSLDGSYTNNSCSVSSCGGGGSTLRRDDCPDGDYSPSYYDHDCGNKHEEENLSEEEESSHTSSPVSPMTINRKDKPQDIQLTRYGAAKIIVENAGALGLEYKDIKECFKFSDISSEQQYYVSHACGMGVMGLEQDRITVAKQFNPNDLIIRAEILTLLSSVLYGDKYGIKDMEDVDTMQRFYWALPHANTLLSDGIVTYISIDWLSKIELKIYFQKMIDRALIMLGGGDLITDMHGSSDIVESTLEPSEISELIKTKVEFKSNTEKALNDLLEDISPKEKQDPIHRLNTLFAK